MRTLIYHLFFTTLIPLTLNAAVKPSCDFNKIKNMHPDSIAAWFAKHPRADKGDLVCCMPKEIQDNFMITNFSVSAQPGVRLLFGKMKNHNFMLSLSAEEFPNHSSGHYHQQNSIEFAVNEGQRINMYDLDLRNSNPKPIKNPESCVGCHGNSDGIYSAAGARLIFDLEPWPRQNGGGLCRNAAKYNNMLTKQSKKKIKDNPDFRCLSRAAIDQVKTSLGEDRDLVEIDARRIANEIITSQDYKFYKYLILGAALNCINFTNDKVSDWIPSFAHPSMQQNLNLTAPQPLTAPLSTIAENARVKALKLHRQRVHQDNELVLPPKDSTDKLAPLPPNLLRSCQNPSQDGERVTNLSRKDESKISNWLKLQSDDLSVKKYIKDEVFKQQSFRTIKNGLFRFIFESRGIDTSSWNISLTRDERVTPTNQLLPILLKDNDFNFLSTQTKLPLFNNQRSKEKLCSRLKMKSRVSLDSSRFRAKINRQQRQTEVDDADTAK